MKTTTNYTDSYDGAFYTSRCVMTFSSARRILGILDSIAPFDSIADFGCGCGTWLSVALEDFEVTHAHGFEGSWMAQDDLDNPRIVFPLTIWRIVSKCLA